MLFSLNYYDFADERVWREDNDIKKDGKEILIQIVGIGIGSMKIWKKFQIAWKLILSNCQWGKAVNKKISKYIEVRQNLSTVTILFLK